MTAYCIPASVKAEIEGSWKRSRYSSIYATAEGDHADVDAKGLHIRAPRFVVCIYKPHPYPFACLAGSFYLYGAIMLAYK
ncbi:hypothetical protein U1Q18_047635 [Sarracenia purpurea var. burkii]